MEKAKFWEGFWSEFWPEFKKDWHVSPNLVTMFRLIFSPVPAILYLYNSDKLFWVAMLVFISVAATDKLDGWMARRNNEAKVTKLGTFLDPTVDKVLIVVTLFALSIINPLVWIPTVIITVREGYVFYFLRRAKNRGRDVIVVYSGKVKMTIQCVAISMLFLPQSGIWQRLTWVAVFIAVVLTITSWIDYIRAFSDAKRREQ